MAPSSSGSLSSPRVIIMAFLGGGLTIPPLLPFSFIPSVNIEKQRVGWDFLVRMVTILRRVTGTWRSWIVLSYLLFLLCSCLEEVPFHSSHHHTTTGFTDFTSFPPPNTNTGCGLLCRPGFQSVLRGVGGPGPIRVLPGALHLHVEDPGRRLRECFP